jgi:hypothetical protein
VPDVDGSTSSTWAAGKRLLGYVYLLTGDLPKA